MRRWAKQAGVVEAVSPVARTLGLRLDMMLDRVVAPGPIATPSAVPVGVEVLEAEPLRAAPEELEVMQGELLRMLLVT